MTGIAFKRAYEISFYPSEENEPSILLAQGIGQTLNSPNPIVKSFAIDFEINSNFPFFNSASQNTASLTIYNLTDKTAKALQQPGVFNIALGYVGNGWVTDVFSGSMVSTSYGKQGSDRYITFDLVSGRLALANRIFQKSYGAGTPKFLIIKDIVTFIQESYFGDQSGEQSVEYFVLPPKYNTIYKQPQAFKKDAIALLAELLPDYYVVLNNKTVSLYPRRSEDINLDYIYGTQFEIAPEYGEIYSSFTGSASIETYETTYSGIDVETVLMPNMQTNSILKMTGSKQRAFSSYNVSSNLDTLGFADELFFRVTNVKHIGSTYSGDYKSQFSAEMLQTAITKLPASLDIGILA